MDWKLKNLNAAAVPAALAKAERYRLLNEPRAAESICLDILAVEANHQQAAILLLLSRTDQFGRSGGSKIADAQEALQTIEGDYEQAYYSGLICERWARGLLTRGLQGCGPVAYEWIVKAIGHYQRAESHSPEGNDDAILRHNTCVRLVQRYRHVRPDDSTVEASWAEEA